MKIFISTHFNSSSREIFAFTNGINVKVYLSGKDLFGNCKKALFDVKMMDLKPATQVNHVVKTSLEAQAKVNTSLQNTHGELSGGANVITETTTDYNTNQYYYYNFTSLFTKQLHYNIVASSVHGMKYQTGWFPDESGGCTYPIPGTIKAVPLY